MVALKAKADSWRSRRGIYGIYTLIALSIMLPLFAPGFILTLDMTFTPALRMPGEVTNTYPFHALLHFLDIALPSEIIQKCMLLGIVLLASIGMHRLLQVIQPLHGPYTMVSIVTASVFFAINPFTYSRFMAGQYAVLLGYALLPWLARSLLIFWVRPTLRQGLLLGGLITVIGIVSIHTLGLAAVLCIVAISVGIWNWHRKLSQLVTHIKYGLAALVIFVVASSYWLVPLVLGKNITARTINQFGAADLEAFQTVGGGVVAQIFNVLRLQGFWVEGRNLYLLPQDLMPLWGTVFLVVFALALYGAMRLWKARPFVATWLVVSGAIGLLVAGGVGVAWLSKHIPFFAGYREPHKFAGLVALCYGVLLAYGVDGILKKTVKKTDWLYTFAAVGLLLVPVLLTRPMWWGFGGQLSPKHYPPDWHIVNGKLNSDPDNFAVLFLPWHQYMSFGFSGRIIANPATKFFDKPTITSRNPEFENLPSDSPDTRVREIDRLLAAKGTEQTDLAHKLAKQNVKYILLAKELDYKTHYYLKDIPSITKLDETQTLQLYKNEAWRKP
ncbi:MAG TPA: hypothetical protein VJ836_04850 [Candidatus Saccharimonadales bacterium]|nr:hypothetical protein [Candidatus Saccharimonadales bacterium]